MAEKILISWMAYSHDFIVDNERARIDENGTHSDFYRYHIKDYARHILLSSSSDDRAEVKLPRKVDEFNRFKGLYRHLIDYLETENIDCKISAKYLDVDVINIQEIKSKISGILENLRSDPNTENAIIEAYISPGTPSMQTAWYLIAQEFGIKLFQIRPPYARPSDYPIPEREYVEITKGTLSIASSLLIKSERTRKDQSRHYSNSKINAAFELADKVAAHGYISALIIGDTGTGKEIIAKRIYQNSFRNQNDRHLIAINCASYSDELLESRLFGYVKGAFTGADKTTDGAFHDANGGVIFLDEIGDISSKMQQTLLRVLQEREVSRIGSTSPEKIDVQIIAGTHQNLWKLIEDGKFRLDLYYRLAVTEINTPSVRDFTPEERKDLFEYFLRKISLEVRHFRDGHHDQERKYLSKEAENVLLKHPFPGNIREIENLFQRFYALVEGGEINVDAPFTSLIQKV